jgi:hypothetical protein
MYKTGFHYDSLPTAELAISGTVKKTPTGGLKVLESEIDRRKDSSSWRGSRAGRSGHCSNNISSKSTVNHQLLIFFFPTLQYFLKLIASGSCSSILACRVL